MLVAKKKKNENQGFSQKNEIKKNQVLTYNQWGSQQILRNHPQRASYKLPDLFTKQYLSIL